MKTQIPIPSGLPLRAFVALTVVLSCVLWARGLGGEQRSFYLISSYPSDLSSDYTMPVLLFELAGSPSTLHGRGEVFSKNAGARMVRPNYESGVIVVGDAAAWYVPERLEAASYRYRAISISRPWILLSEFGPIQARGSLKDYFLLPPDGEPLWAISLFDGGKYTLTAWQIRTGKAIEGLPWSYLRYWRSHGVPALGVQGFDATDLTLGSDGKLLIREAGGPRNFPETDWRVPETVEWKESDRIFPFVINDKSVVIAAVEDRLHRPGEAGEAPLYFLDRTRNRWHRRVIKGGGSAVRGFGEWVAGYVAETKQPKQAPKIAGQSEWAALDAEREQRGLRKIALKFQWWEQDAPGILFAYHFPTRRYYEFNTNQGDSEVLLIEEDGTVHFRVLDKLYRGSLAEATFSGVELLLQDPRIVDVHWMFRGDPWPEELEGRVWTDDAPP